MDIVESFGLHSLQNAFGVLFLISFLVLVYHWLFYYAQLISYKPQSSGSHSPQPVSIIIAFKNEAHHLEKLLCELKNQNYLQFEILLVNDHSSDDFKNLINEDHQIRLIDLPQDTSGKKQAIAYGIKHARHEVLLFLDADCLPKSKEWIKQMTDPLLSGKDIVLGYSGFYSEKTILNRLIRFETFMNGIQYLSFALNGRPYMGVGRNMAYRKSLVINNDEIHVKDIKSGDDDLLVNRKANRQNTSIQICHGSQTISEAESTFNSYVYQRRRQLQAGTHYKTLDRLHLAVIGLSQLFFATSIVFAIIHLEFLLLIYPFVLVKWIIQLIITYFLTRKMGEKELWYWTPIIETVYIFLILGIGISTWIWKVDRWK